MFANRYTALIDACVLVRVLPRNCLLSLAEAEFFRARWSQPILDEAERAMARLFEDRGKDQEAARQEAALQTSKMVTAFDEAMVLDFEHMIPAASVLPDPDDAHVLAAALKAQAATIVTDNLKDFPAHILTEFGMEVRSTDEFIADTISLDEGRAVEALRGMRERFRKPELTADELLLHMEAAGLLNTVDTLRPFAGSL